MAQKPLLSLDEVLRAKELYFKDLDGRGRQKWTVGKLGKLFGVSDSTMLRALNSESGYREVPRTEVPLSEVQEAEAAGALERLQKVALQELGGDALLEELVEKAGTEGAPIGEEAKERARGFLKD